MQALLKPAGLGYCPALETRGGCQVLISATDSQSELNLGISDTRYSTYKLDRCAAARGLAACHTRQMDIQELEQRLVQEGCNPNSYAIGCTGLASDAYCLTHDGEEWSVYYTERGQHQAPVFKSHIEDDACQFFFRHMMGLRHNHCVGFFRSEARAQSLLNKLMQHGLNAHQDKIPYGGPLDPRYRVFVVGKAIFKAKELLGAVPVRD